MCLIIFICDMLISGKALCYQSYSLFLNVCPHFQDHHKVHLFHQNTYGEYFEYFSMDLHLFHDSALQPIFLDLSLSLESGDLMYSGIKDFCSGSLSSRPRLRGDFLMLGLRSQVVAGYPAFF